MDKEDPYMLSAEDLLVKFCVKGRSHDVLNAGFWRGVAYKMPPTKSCPTWESSLFEAQSFLKRLLAQMKVNSKVAYSKL